MIRRGAASAARRRCGDNVTADVANRWAPDGRESVPTCSIDQRVSTFPPTMIRGRIAIPDKDPILAQPRPQAEAGGGRTHDHRGSEISSGDQRDKRIQRLRELTE